MSKGKQTARNQKISKNKKSEPKSPDEIGSSIDNLPKTHDTSQTSPLSKIIPALLLLLFTFGLFAMQDRNGVLPASPRNQVSFKPDSNYPVRFIAYLKLIPPDTTDDNHLRVQLEKIEYEVREGAGWKESTDELKLCITAIWLDQVAKDTTLNVPITIADHDFTELDTWICKNPKEKGVIEFDEGELLDNSIYTAINSPDFFVYPFDSFALEYFMFVYYSVIKDPVVNEINIVAALSEEPIEFVFVNESKNWEYKAEKAYFPYTYKGFEYTNFNFISIDFYRSTTSQLLPVALFLFILIVTFAVSFMKDPAIFWGGIITVSVGVIGIRQILLPDYIKISTAWDYVTIGLLAYIVFCVVAYKKR